MGDGLERRLERLLCRLVAVVVRVEGCRVHAHAPDEGALAQGQAQVRQQVGGGHVDGGKVGGRCGAVGQRAPHTGRVDLACPGEVLEAGLERERVLLEPVEQRRLAKDARVGVL